MSEIDPERIVIHGAQHTRNSQQPPVIHTKEYCQYVQTLAEPQARKYKEVPDEWDLCKWCTDSYSEVQGSKMSDLLKKSNPEDFGLSPMEDDE